MRDGFYSRPSCFIITVYPSELCENVKAAGSREQKKEYHWRDDRRAGSTSGQHRESGSPEGGMGVEEVDQPVGVAEFVR